MLFFPLLYNKEYTHWIEWNCTSLPAVLTFWWALESAELLSHTFTREAALLGPPRCHSLLSSYDMRFQIKKSLRDWTACDADMKVWPRHTSDGSDQSWPDAVLKTQMCEYRLRDESADFSDPASRPTVVARIPRQKSLRRYELMKSNARCGFAC